MHVVDHAPHAWFLFKHEDAYLLDVNCSHSAVGYSVLIRLTEEEEAEYALAGRAFLDRLAQAVQDAGPGSTHQLRDLTKTFAKETRLALEAWRQAHS